MPVERAFEAAAPIDRTRLAGRGFVDGVLAGAGRTAPRTGPTHGDSERRWSGSRICWSRRPASSTRPSTSTPSTRRRASTRPSSTLSSRRSCRGARPRPAPYREPGARQDPTGPHRMSDHREAMLVPLDRPSALAQEPRLGRPLQPRDDHRKGTLLARWTTSAWSTPRSAGRPRSRTSPARHRSSGETLHDLSFAAAPPSAAPSSFAQPRDAKILTGPGPA